MLSVMADKNLSGNQQMKNEKNIQSLYRSIASD